MLQIVFDGENKANEINIMTEELRERLDSPDELNKLLSLFPEATDTDTSYHCRIHNERIEFCGNKDVANVYRDWGRSTSKELFPLQISTFVQSPDYHGNMGINTKYISTRLVVIRFIKLPQRYSGNIILDLKAMSHKPNAIIVNGQESIDALFVVDKWLSANEANSAKHSLVAELPNLKRNLYNKEVWFVSAVGIESISSGRQHYTPTLKVLHRDILSVESLQAPPPPTPIIPSRTIKNSRPTQWEKNVKANEVAQIVKEEIVKEIIPQVEPVVQEPADNTLIKLQDGKIVKVVLPAGIEDDLEPWNYEGGVMNNEL